ncbi:carboxymuconolactone decarboxylase family protein [Sediminibacterium ginsengisoli]|uniref:Alkylhydroperoxidase AhpD family core domain-containing protein n=1 Tax=Sediminibacterium ginsengisoli TaxID=413434 RepID=A0A1T4LCJ9_9BACT|nr:carboxymuconolactone decarboxylase family protein [Sediminibacterium ginsengisoli]SJZ52381.1 alkylhydroperoxidase AhpD family core domain-containing protein [Sediminibacterium ginsengisoli]
MTKRININQSEPAAYKAMLGLEQYIAGTELEAAHKELIKIRASQLNGCAFCLNMHTKDARKLGMSEEKIYLLNAWKETSFYTPAEKALLALTEEVTLIAAGGLSDATYAEAVARFGEQYTGQAIMAIVAINGWNRIAISTRLEPAL